MNLFIFQKKICFETAILPNSIPTVFLFHPSTIFSIKSYKCLMAMKLIPDSLWMAGCPNAHRSAQYCPALSQVAGGSGTPACLHASPPAFQLYWKICPKKHFSGNNNATKTWSKTTEILVSIFRKIIVASPRQRSAATVWEIDALDSHSSQTSTRRGRSYKTPKWSEPPQL